MVKAKLNDALNSKDANQLIMSYQILSEVVDDLDLLIQKYLIDRWDKQHLINSRQALILEMKIIFGLLEKENIHVYGSQRERLRSKL